MAKKLAAVILAAGKGRRIGHPKLFLELGGVPFWRLISGRLRKAGIRDMVVVVRRSQKGSVDKDKERLVRVAVNRNPSWGMFSSIQCGLRAMKGFDGYLLCPVDHPGVKVRTYEKLHQGFQKNPEAVARPIFQGKRGHPIVIPKNLADRLLNSNPSNRLDYLIQRMGWPLIDIKVKDKYIIFNINTYKELEIAGKHLRSIICR